ncbi:MAG TPA: AI-2E family transporter [Acidiferrobacterales bacterium]|nr:AI-2E family transporter [Acidiferrobacterales bacterium]
MDIKPLRKQALQHIDEGAVTAGFAADRETMLKVVKDALATEIERGGERRRASRRRGTWPTVRVPLHGRRLAFGILVAVALVFALEWAQSFVISLLLGIVFAYTLNPVVMWLERIKIPRVVGTIAVMLGVVCALVLGTYSLRGPMQTILEQLPEAAGKVSEGLASMRDGQLINMQKVQTVAREMEKATSQTASIPSAPKQPATHVVVDAPAFKFGNFLWAGSMGALGFIGQAVMVAFLVFFLLLGGDTFKRKLIRLSGPSLSRKKITVHILDDINNSIQQYMFMLLTTNVLVALLTWIAFRWIGLENAGAWAVAAGLLHIIPYVGPGVTAAATGMAAFMQFDAFSMALLVSGASLAIATVVGTFVTTWMTGKIAKIHKAAVFISLLFWGWLWGVWGMLLSIPIIVIAKVVSQHVEQLQPIAELLGE